MSKVAKKPVESVDASSIQASKVLGSLDVVPPPGSRASLMMRMISTEIKNEQSFTTFTCWLAVGRNGQLYNEAKYVPGGIYTVRLDVRAAVEFLNDDLARAIQEVVDQDDTLPPDTTVVVK